MKKSNDLLFDSQARTDVRVERGRMAWIRRVLSVGRKRAHAHDTAPEGRAEVPASDELPNAERGSNGSLGIGFFRRNIESPFDAEGPRTPMDPCAELDSERGVWAGSEAEERSRERVDVDRIGLPTRGRGTRLECRARIGWDGRSRWGVVGAAGSEDWEGIGPESTKRDDDR